MYPFRDKGHRDPHIRAPRQTIGIIIDSGNHYLAALKGNQPTLSDLEESARDFARRIRGNWGVENKVP